MSNPLFQAMNPQGDIIHQFNQFRQNFRGNPKAEVMRMLQSGQISQQQLNAAQAQAQQLMTLFGTK
jgi:hypothetical protein